MIGSDPGLGFSKSAMVKLDTPCHILSIKSTSGHRLLDIMCRKMLNIYDSWYIYIYLIYIYILDGIKQLSIYQTLSTYKYMHRLLYYIRICEPYVYMYIHLLYSLLPDKHQCTCLAGCRLPLPNDQVSRLFGWFLWLTGSMDSIWPCNLSNLAYLQSGCFQNS